MDPSCAPSYAYLCGSPYKCADPIFSSAVIIKVRHRVLVWRLLLSDSHSGHISIPHTENREPGTRGEARLAVHPKLSINRRHAMKGN